MGRRARTNCSPVDSMLEKYHNDIGNRLSGVFMPPTTANNTDATTQNLCEDFCMLTLDLRRANSIKNKNKSEQQKLTLTETAQSNKTISTLQQDSQQETMANPVSETFSDQDSTNVRDKSRLVDKLTRALFQKKHICARCKRKSRSCILNKTFSATEKHYTCGRCRENSSALKNLFDGQTNNSDASSSSPLSSFSSPASSKSQPRTCNDSGYETVTSCSTVASSYSAFSKNISNQENPTRSQDLASSDCQFNSTVVPVSSHHHHFEDTACPATATTTCPVQQSLQTRRLPAAHEYDGYLPDFIEFRGWARQCIRPCSQNDALSIQDEQEDAKDSPSGVVCLRRPSSLDASPKQGEKACHTCGSTTAPCFRLPWEGGWLCEDCMDGVF